MWFRFRVQGNGAPRTSGGGCRSGGDAGSQFRLNAIKDALVLTPSADRARPLHAREGGLSPFSRTVLFLEKNDYNAPALPHPVIFEDRDYRNRGTGGSPDPPPPASPCSGNQTPATAAAPASRASPSSRLSPTPSSVCQLHAQRFVHCRPRRDGHPFSVHARSLQYMLPLALHCMHLQVYRPCLFHF
jgi:hypothetical protein